MGLAKYGAMHLIELKRLAGVDGAKPEGPNNAPFGRSGAVRTWSTCNGLATELDPAFPVSLELRTLLLKLEQCYPLPSHVPLHAPPYRPQLKAWKGDRLALFGGPVPTGILTTIGALGWTFEALCVAACTGSDRVVVKKALKSLEAAGILSADREPRPGFNVRILTLAPSFAAAAELDSLLKAFVRSWPEFADRVRTALTQLSPRTREQFRRRGLDLAQEDRFGATRVQADGRQQCFRRYIELSINQGIEVPSNRLMQIDSNLYRGIRKHWSSFTAFRIECGLPSTMPGTTSSPNEALKRRCISSYRKMAARLGFLPASGDLNREDGWLGELIRVQWGSFPEFCAELRIAPARCHSHGSRIDLETRRERCRSEFFSIMRRVGHRPTLYEIKLHTRSLDKRILKSWASFEEFCADVGVMPPRKRSQTTQPGRTSNSV